MYGQSIEVASHPDIQLRHAAYLVVCPEGVQYSAMNGGKTNGRIQTSLHLGSTVETEIEVEQATLIAVDNDPALDHILPDGGAIRLSFDPVRCYLLPYET